ncbi:DUF3793 family protein [Clostridium tarantellae]|uniref:DUF3793 family protein n=2 Tax=Clostridium tarantellae TaxID=39493 RepID=A0A6I1MQE9_9CLOT|nr:DUF3793 family protein [Clostridium tarantellae]
MDNKDYFENFIIYNTSLVSAGLKPAATINIKKSDCKNSYGLWCRYGDSFLKNINLEYIVLRDTEDSIILLVYDKILLEIYLNKPYNKLLLIELGYDEEDTLSECLSKLKKRYDICKCPHELGIFLGYPVDDVKDFMNNTKKKCLVCGYWKVYNRYNEAQKTFSLYDKAKEVTIDNIINGRCTINLALYLREYFSNNKILAL